MSTVDGPPTSVQEAVQLLEEHDGCMQRSLTIPAVTSLERDAAIDVIDGSARPCDCCDRSVFQLGGLFPRPPRPARTVLRPARFTQRPARINQKKKKIIFYLKIILYFLQNVIAVFVCKMLADLCPCFHQSLTQLCPDLVSSA